MFQAEYTDYIPEPLPQREDANVQGWARGHQTLFDALDDDLEYVIESYQVGRAQGLDLDQIGKRYGILGKRRGRGDGAYRQYLQALVGAYTGRGTPRDQKIAVGGGVRADPDTVDIEQDYAALEYHVTLHEWASHATSVVDRLANVADPSVVRRVPPIGYVLGAGRAGVHAGETVETTARIRAPPGGVGVAGGETDAVVVDSTGYGASGFE